MQMTKEGHMNFEYLVGQEFAFYGVDANNFKLSVGVFEAIEDESDGYRSYLGTIELKDPVGLVFPALPIATVRVEDTSTDDYNGYSLVGVEDGHVWLRVGTDNYADYYPCFTFDYSPKKG
jgi:hypothetical protein